MIRERYEDGKKIISVDTTQEFGQVFEQLDNYRVEIEAPQEVIEAFGSWTRPRILALILTTKAFRPRHMKEAG